MPREMLLDCGALTSAFRRRKITNWDSDCGRWAHNFSSCPAAVAYEYFVKPSQRYMQYDGEAYGRTEVWLCRKHPEHRPLSRLAGVGKDKVVEEFPRRMVLQFPMSPANLFRAPIWICERCSVLQRCEELVCPCWRTDVDWRKLHGAVKEAGS